MAKEQSKNTKLELTESIIAKKLNRLKNGVIPALICIVILSFAVAVLTKVFSVGAGESLSDGFSKNGWIQIFSLWGIITVLLGTYVIYVDHTQPEILLKKRYFGVVIAAVFFTFIVAAVLGRFLSPYAMPLGIGSLFVATLVGRKQGIVCNLFCCVTFFVVFVIMFGEAMLIGAAVSLVSSAVAGTVLIIRMDKSYTRGRFLVGSIIIALFMMPVAILTSLLLPDFNWTDSLNIAVWTALSAVLNVVLFLPLLPIFEYIFKLPTNFNLEEICSFNRPLLKRLRDEAPGTFNHSLAVGNLAQICAIAIGENPQLAKAAAYYHDIGKLKDPACYVENQKDYNPHDDFIPEVSVYMITQHTKWGYEMLAQERDIPQVIADIAKEHHGTTPVNYFYYKVLGITEDAVDTKEFSYDGPIPSNKISAIIMITDTVEAAIRAIGIGDEKTLRNNIHKLIDEKMKIGQFDNSNLTFKDIKIIEDTLVETLPGIYHNRISYTPKNK